jgi:hypothetical protein
LDITKSSAFHPCGEGKGRVLNIVTYQSILWIQLSNFRTETNLIEGYFLSNVLYSFGLDWVTWVQDQIGGNIVSHMHN